MTYTCDNRKKQKSKIKINRQVDRRKAIANVINDAKAGDVVLIAGKGHEEQQIFSDGAGGLRKVRFSDMEVAREALKSRAGR